MELPTQNQSYPTQPVPETPPASQPAQNYSLAGGLQTLSLWQKFWMGLAALLLVVFAVTYLPRLIIKPARITAVGVGEVDFKPDEVRMVVTKASSGTDSTQVIGQGDADVQSLINTAKTVAPDAEVNKSFYRAAPSVGLTGQTTYHVANAFSLKFSDIDQASRMVQALYGDGATTVSDVQFTSADKETIEQEAREEAVKDAKMKAKKIAKAAGKRLGRMVTISDDYKQASSNVSSTGGSDAGSDFSNVSLSKAISIIYEVW